MVGRSLGLRRRRLSLRGDADMDTDNRGAWTPKMVFFNTLGTVAGALSGWVALFVLIYLEFLK